MLYVCLSVTNRSSVETPRTDQAEGMTTHADPRGAATTWVVWLNT